MTWEYPPPHGSLWNLHPQPLMPPSTSPWAFFPFKGKVWDPLGLFARAERAPPGSGMLVRPGFCTALPRGSRARASGKDGACPAYIQVTGKPPWLEQKQHMDITYPRGLGSASPLRSCAPHLPNFLLKLPIFAGICEQFWGSLLFQPGRASPGGSLCPAGFAIPNITIIFLALKKCRQHLGSSSSKSPGNTSWYHL